MITLDLLRRRGGQRFGRMVATSIRRAGAAVDGPAWTRNLGVLTGIAPII